MGEILFKNVCKVEHPYMRSNMKEQGKKSRFIIERGQISRSDVIESISGKEDVCSPFLLF